MNTYQYRRLRKPSLKTTKGFLMLSGPSPGDPSPPRMQVLTHLVVQDSAFLDLGRWILGFLQSFRVGHSPDSSCGMFDSVSESDSRSCSAREAAVGSKSDNDTANPATEAKATERRPMFTRLWAIKHECGCCIDDEQPIRAILVHPLT